MQIFNNTLYKNKRKTVSFLEKVCYHIILIEQNEKYILSYKTGKVGRRADMAEKKTKTVKKTAKIETPVEAPMPEPIPLLTAALNEPSPVMFSPLPI